MYIIYLGRDSQVVDGGTIVARRNQKALDVLCNGQLSTILVDHKNKWKKLGNILLQRPLGYDFSIISELKSIISQNKIDHIFIEHSLLGGFCEVLHAMQVPTTVFFQNIEYLYYQDKTKVDGVLNRLMVGWAGKTK